MPVLFSHQCTASDMMVATGRYGAIDLARPEAIIWMPSATCSPLKTAPNTLSGTMPTLALN
jgi:hypothetical protein